MLALDRHIRKNGGSGTICHFIMEFDESTSPNELRSLILNSDSVNYLAGIHLKKNKWEYSEAAFEIIELNSDLFIPEEINSFSCEKNKAPLFTFHLVNSNIGVRLIFSWHHLLMDGYGAKLLMQYIFQNNDITNVIRKKSPINLSHFIKARKAKRYISKSAKNAEVSHISKVDNPSTAHIKVIAFSRDQQEQLKLNARTMKAKYGIGNYLLAAAALSLYQFRNEKESLTYWVPIPQDQRKKGAKGPLIGNHLSMLFYRITIDKNSTLSALVKELDAQMLSQIKSGVTENYTHLLNYMRNTPTWLYHKMIKGPNGKSLSSFLFTYAPENSTETTVLKQGNIKAIYNIPPNTYPPGLTFSMNQYDQELQMIIQYFSDVLSESETEEFVKILQKNILRTT